MAYKSCQDKFNCPDTIGHMGQLFLLTYFLSWLIDRAGFHIHWLVLLVFAVLWGFGIEVYECLRWGDKSLSFWPRYKKWMDYRDSRKDILNDTVGAVLGLLVYYHCGYSWIVFLIVALISVAFGRFISWQQLKDNFFDWRIWKYL